MRKAIFSTGGSTLERFSSKTEVKKATSVKKRTTREKKCPVTEKGGFYITFHQNVTMSKGIAHKINWNKKVRIISWSQKSELRSSI